MDNYDISDSLNTYSKLADLHDENPFKVKAFASAAFNIKKIKDPLANLPDSELDKVPGVGKTVIGAIRTLLLSQTFPDLQKLIELTPPGVIDILKIKGLGPKKVKVIWKNMGIDSVESLFDACRENRLVEQTGFGLKTQGEVLKAIEFSWNASGKFHFARALKPAEEILKLLRSALPNERVEFTGEFRRTCDTLEEVEILTSATEKSAQEVLVKAGFEFENNLFKDSAAFKYRVTSASKSDFDKTWFESSANPQHLSQIGYDTNAPFNSELEIYLSKGLSFIPPEMREGAGEVERAKTGNFDNLLTFAELKGCIHNHSTYSDGLHSLKEMAEHCKHLGYQYFGICDHSRSAGYAGGLSTDRVLQQWDEIDKLNAELGEFRIIKGIESDILGDGSLDYENDVLAGFELVVASVHSNIKMDKDKANTRLKRAIENPYTHILGHPTARLLLIREGYPIDHAYIIDACAANGVAIEINANPFRLDIDWRWIGYAMEKGVMLSINPDAHEKTALNDMFYGTISARKGGLTKEFTLNALPLADFTNWLNKKRSASFS